MVHLYSADVLVIGSGSAGLRASIEARIKKADVLVVSKAPSGMNNATVLSGGGFRAAVGGFKAEEHLAETVEVGKHLNDEKLVKILANEGGTRVLELRDFGVQMTIRNGIVSVGTIPTLMGLGITKPLLEYARSINVSFLENIVVTKLLKTKGRVVGAVGFDLRKEDVAVFASKAVVLATGGAGGLYKRTDCPLRNTGDGYSLGYHAGVRLRDMEFVQFFPLALAEPGSPPYLLGGAISEEGHILNAKGEEIPKKYNLTARPLALKSRDLLSRAIMMEILGGRGVDGAILIDAREVFRNRRSDELASTGPTGFLINKLDAANRPIKVAPVCHFCMGGIVIDEHGYTGVPGLYAAGEVVGGIHGANRHGGNALTDTVVFGARAGAASAEYASQTNPVSIAELVGPETERYIALLSTKEQLNPRSLLDKVRDTMWNKVGIVRSERLLHEGKMELEALRGVAGNLAAGASEVLALLEVQMALDTAEMILMAGLVRKESRGAHYRTDYPEEDPAGLRPIHISKGEDGMMRLIL